MAAAIIIRRKGIIFFICLLSIASTALSDELDNQLKAAARGVSASQPASLERFENTCHELLQRYAEPEQQGRIYCKLATVYGNSGAVRNESEKMIEYVQEALKYPLEPPKKLQMYVYWGDAIQIASRGLTGKEMAAVRPKTLAPYLLGLKEALQYDLPDERPELPGVSRYDASNFEEAGKLKQAHDLEVAARALAQFQREMIDSRNTLTDQIVFLYTRMPFATEELRELAARTLENPAAVDKLIVAVEDAAGERTRVLLAPGFDPREALEDFDGEALRAGSAAAMTPTIPETKAGKASAAVVAGNNAPQVAETPAAAEPTKGHWLLIGATAAGLALLIAAGRAVYRRKRPAV